MYRDFDGDLVRRQVTEDKCQTVFKDDKGEVYDPEIEEEEETVLDTDYALIGSKDMIFYDSTYAKRAFETGRLDTFQHLSNGSVVKRSLRFFYTKID